jgi:hypothetical protein
MECQGTLIKMNSKKLRGGWFMRQVIVDEPLLQLIADA